MMVVTTPSEREGDSPRVSYGAQTAVRAGPAGGLKTQGLPLDH